MPPDSSSPNYYKLTDVASPDAFREIATTLLAVMERVFGYAGEPALSYICSIPGLVS